MRKCERCGTIVDGISNFCPECGSTMIVDVDPDLEVNKEIDATPVETGQMPAKTDQPVDSPKLEKKIPRISIILTGKINLRFYDRIISFGVFSRWIYL